MGRFITIKAVTRGLLAFAVVAVGLSGAAAACAAPVVEPNSPQAQATSVRRTEVAVVQRIIANNPTATSTAAPTAAAPPTCQAQGAIWWYEARAHMGELRTARHDRRHARRARVAYRCSRLASRILIRPVWRY